ncbi:quinone oxidoreductase PIG3 [Antennarius striatus]|uniref:quinone oxidoreductase PIG3 n=1 Tax=Antennarius striatus TaxID=241820 RepID=UPI0035AEB920
MMRAVCVEAPGRPCNLVIRTIPRPQPKDKEVLIQVYATALNRADLLQRRGLYDPPEGESEIIGLEVAGTVHTLGPGVERDWKLGDRVMALLAGGGYAEYVAVREELIMHVPPNLTVWQAAAIPEAWITAFQLLVFVAQVKEKEVVLINAGASGVGTAAIQLVRHLGAISMISAGTMEKLVLAASLGASVGFNYKEENFTRALKDFTGGRGVDVILDCIGGYNWEQNVNCLATGGRWVVYGRLGGQIVEGDLFGKLLHKRGQLLCSLLRSRSIEYKAELVKAFSDRVLPFFSGKDPKLKPVIDSTFGLEDISEAHCRMEANKNMGKIVIYVVPQPVSEEEEDCEFYLGSL